MKVLKLLKGICYNQCYYKGDIMTAIKLTTVGNSTGAVIPKDILERLHVSKGDTLYLVEDENGFRLTHYNEDFLNQIDIAEEIMKEDCNALKVLAK